MSRSVRRSGGWLWLGLLLLAGCAKRAPLPSEGLYFLQRSGAGWSLAAADDAGSVRVLYEGVDDFAVGPQLALVLEEESVIALWDGGAPEAIARCPEGCRAPAWSPGGEQLAWIAVVDERGQVQVWDPATGRIRTLGVARSAPTWAAQGLRLAYPAAEGLVIWDLNAGISETVALPVQGRPAWSPDGTGLAVVLQTGEAVWVTPGQRFPVPLELSADRAVVEELAWSPRGDRLALARLRYGAPESEGTEAPVETGHEERLGAETLGGQPWLLELDGGTLRALPGDPAAAFARLSWSPDGTRLAMVRMPLGVADPRPELWVLDAAAGTLLFRIPNGAAPAWVDGSG